MKTFITNYRTAINYLQFIISIFCVLLFIRYSSTIKESAIISVNNCLNIIVPCVFPMLCLAYFILETGFPTAVKKFLRKITEPAFGLGENCSEAIIISLCAGYNTAVKSAVKLYSEKKISEEQAKRIALFFTNAGISFTVNITGSVLYNSFATGLRLYIISISVNIITAFLYNLYRKNYENETSVVIQKNVSTAFIKSVKASSEAILSICFNIIFFSALCSAVSAFIPQKNLSILIKLFGEATSGIIFASENYPIYITALCLNFGGICIFLQNLSDIVKIGIKPHIYLSVKLFQSIICSLTEFLLSIFFPTVQSVFAGENVTAYYGKSYIGTFSLLLLCAVFLVSTKNLHRNRNLRH